MGWEQGEWTWVRNRRRKALGLERDGRNGQRQGNGQGGLGYSLEHRGYQSGRNQCRSRSASKKRLRVAPSRVRVMQEADHGRSQTFRYGRPFSCSRDRNGTQYGGGAMQGFKETQGCYNGVDQIRLLGNKSGNSSKATQVSVVFYITNFSGPPTLC